MAYKNLAINYRDYGKYLGEKQGDLDASILYLKKAEKMQQDDPETLRLLGVAHGVKGKLEDAIKYFRKALTVHEDNADVWYNLGVALMQSGQELEAQEAIRKAQELNPEKYDN